MTDLSKPDARDVGDVERRGCYVDRIVAKHVASPVYVGILYSADSSKFKLCNVKKCCRTFFYLQWYKIDRPSSTGNIIEKFHHKYF